MLLSYVPILPADCTSDPHPVAYSGDETREIYIEMLKDILMVCESPMVQNVRSVHIAFGDNELAADRYVDYCMNEEKAKKSEGEFAEKHKTQGLWFSGDAETERQMRYDDEGDGRHMYGFFRALPPGLTGIKRAVEYVEKHLGDKDTVTLTIGVVWSFAGDSSCSDYIEINGEYCTGFSVNYGSQDWWIQADGYHDWCDEMEALLGKHFPRETR